MDLGRYYDKDGNIIPFDDWSKLYTGEYKRVAETTLPDGTWISTVWLGIDYSFGMGAPVIFETMVFEKDADSADERDMDRYSTLAEAEQGHQRMVEKWFNK